MIDIALNDNGDIMFEENEGYEESLLLNFIISNSSSLQLNMYIDNSDDIKFKKKVLQLNILLDVPEYNKEIITISNEEFYEQAIKLRISTALNSVYGNTDMGSKIESFKHRNITEKRLYEYIESEVKRCLSDIMPSAEIRVEKYKTYYREFYNALKITVINKGKYYYYYL